MFILCSCSGGGGGTFFLRLQKLKFFSAKKVEIADFHGSLEQKNYHDKYKDFNLLIVFI